MFEANGIGIRESELALAALAALNGSAAPDAALTLLRLGRRFGVNGLEAALQTSKGG